MSLYDRLGVSRVATDEEIRRAYRAKARLLHPDARPGDVRAADDFRELQYA